MTSALEKLTSVQGRMMMELRNDINRLKDTIIDIKEMLRNLKKGDRLSDGGESSVNGEERRDERVKQSSKSEGEEEGEWRPWSRRIELPMFEGVDPMGWLARAEKFFEVQNVSAREKLQLAFISVEGSASSWFVFWRKNSKNQSWEEFSLALICRFGGKERSSVFEKLAKLIQNGRVEDYIQEFEGLVSQAPQTGEE